MTIPQLPFDEYRFCLSERWRVGKIIYTIVSLVYGTVLLHCSVITAQRLTTFLAEDGSTFLIIIYWAKYRGLLSAHGVPSIFDKILQDATVYFLVIFTGHLLVILFEIFAPVSNPPVAFSLRLRRAGCRTRCNFFLQGKSLFRAPGMRLDLTERYHTYSGMAM